jgi:hypothetical protein
MARITILRLITRKSVYLDAGECLVDNIEVRTPTAVNYVSNGRF